jgi:hypothetical protein
MTKPLVKAQLLRLSRPFLQARTARRQRLVMHLHQAGPRPTMEALLSVSAMPAAAG